MAVALAVVVLVLGQFAANQVVTLLRAQDWYHDSYDGAPTDGSAWESPTGSNRVVRGGSWYDDARFVRAAGRGIYSAGYRYVGLGFRVARSVR